MGSTWCEGSLGVERTHGVEWGPSVRSLGVGSTRGVEWIPLGFEGWLPIGWVLVRKGLLVQFC